MVAPRGIEQWNQNDATDQAHQDAQQLLNVPDISTQCFVTTSYFGNLVEPSNDVSTNRAWVDQTDG